MKKNLLLFVLIFSSTAVFAQDYMDDIASKACDCLNSITPGLDKDRYSMELGLCVIEAASPYQKELKKDYKIDFNKIDKQGAELGRIIGLRMVGFCPDALVKLVGETEEQKTEVAAKSIIEGQVTKIVDDKFIEFSIKDDFGKISKYYWFTFIESNMELSSSYNTLLEQFVQITFIPQEFFDARIGEYRTFNVIEKLQRLKE